MHLKMIPKVCLLKSLLDSFDVVTLVTALDEEYKISIDGLDVLPDNFSTVNTIVVLLSKYGVK